MDIIKEHETNEQQPFPLGLPGTTAKYYYTQKKDVLHIDVWLKLQKYRHHPL